MNAAPRREIILGDALDALRAMPSDYAHACVTSPPYYGLRDYGVDGQIGLESTPQAFVARLVEVFREVRRVLRPDGTLWLNLGDTYATGAGAVGDCPGGGEQGARWRGDASRVRDSYRRDREPVIPRGPLTQPNRMKLPGLKPKDLIGIPWRAAFALQDDGWWLRQDIVWSKPNPMPESVRDRCTKSHEYLFLLAKSECYAWDPAAMQERAACPEGSGNTARNKHVLASESDDRFRTKANLHKVGPRSTRNRRSVWTVSTKPFRGAHFATFPPDLIEPCVLASVPPGGIVLDPFFGAGTVGVVAVKHGRGFVGVELNPEYVAIARRRIGIEEHREPRLFGAS